MVIFQFSYSQRQLIYRIRKVEKYAKIIDFEGTFWLSTALENFLGVQMTQTKYVA